MIPIQSNTEEYINYRKFRTFLVSYKVLSEIKYLRNFQFPEFEIFRDLIICKKYFSESTLFWGENIHISNLSSTNDVDRILITSDFGRNFFKKSSQALHSLTTDAASLDKISKIRGTIFVQSICPKVSEILILSPKFNVRHLTVRHFW